MIRKSNAAFSDEKIYKKMAKEWNFFPQTVAS
jgi:hypothetical protein